MRAWESLRRLMRHRTAVALLIGVGVFEVLFGLRSAGFLESLELGAYDNLLRLRPTTGQTPVVTHVWVTEEEIRVLGHPMQDQTMAKALRILAELGPRAIGVDIYRDVPTGTGWDELAEVFLENPQITIVEKLGDASHPGVPGPAFLPDKGQIGFADLMIDRDGVGRRGFLWLWGEDGTANTSFALQLALRFLDAEGIGPGPDPDDPEFIRLGATTIFPLEPDLGGYVDADAGGYQFLLDYRQAAADFPEMQLLDVLTGQIDPDLIRDRVVIIGTRSASVKDDFQSPTSLFFSEGGRIYGAAVHAQIVDQLVRLARGQDKVMGSYDDRAETLWLLAWCLLGALIGARVQSPLGLLIAILVGSGVLVGSGYVSFITGRWIPTVPPFIGGIGSLLVVVAYVIQQERADRLKAMNLFGRFVSRKLAADIWKNRDLFMEGGRPKPQRITVTVMFTDLSGYTGTSEKREPAEVMQWIGGYMDRMANLVEEHGGIVNDFLGDGLMASFGVPIPSATEEEMNRDACNAVECALEMGETLDELNEDWRRHGESTARVRVGIYTGLAVVGTIGSEDRLKYATVGNTVNTASRLESFDKDSFREEEGRTSCRVLIGDPTWRRLGDRFATRCLGDHILKGKSEAVTIHRVIGRRSPVGYET